MARKPTPKKKLDKDTPTEADVLPPGYIDPIEYQTAQAGVIWSYDDTGHLLTIEQQLFCRSYIIDRNPVAAMRRLGFIADTPKLKRMAGQMLENTEVQGCIDVLAKTMMDRLAITAENVNRRLAAVAFFDPRTIAAFDHTGLQLKHSRFWSLDEAWAVAGVKEGKDGVEIKFHDGVRAAEILGKQLGSIKDETGEAAALASKAAADAVIGSIIDVFRKTREERRGEILIEAQPESQQS